jgi:hypothetical protein
MKTIALAYGDKFSIDAHYTIEESNELREFNGNVSQFDYVTIEIQKITMGFIGLPEIDITKLLTKEHIGVIVEQIHNWIESENNFGN